MNATLMETTYGARRRNVSKRMAILIMAMLLLGARAAIAESALSTMFNMMLGARTDAVAVEQVDTTGHASALDSESRKCLSCHDGTMAIDVLSVTSGSTDAMWAGTRSLDHPVGVLYRRSIFRKPGEYVHESSLDAAVRLVDGKVSCVSCHRTKKVYRAKGVASGVALEGHSGCTGDSGLVVSNYRSSLCLSCHIK